MLRKSRIGACLAAAILLGGSAAAHADTSGQPSGFLCGLDPTVDALLGCSQSAPQAPASPADSAAAAQEQLAAAPAVERSSTRATYLPNVLIVRFGAGVSYSRGSGLLARLGARTQMQIAPLRVRIVVVSPSRRDSVLSALRASPLVARADLDEVLRVMGSTLNDTFFSQQWGLRVAGFTNAWAHTQGTHPVVVGVVDTGVTASSPDLAGLVRPGVDLVNGDNDASDDNGHGTAVAGVIAAHANNAMGGAGACWRCSILPIKVMGANGSGDLATVAAGIVKAADMGAKVIDVSLGGPTGEPALQQAAAYASSKGALIVAAAGNSGLPVPFYPASYPNVISVGGSDQSDRLYPWSEHGSWVRVSAPGCNVAPLLHGGYGEFCGTSSATPLVAALAGYLLSVRPQATIPMLIAAIEKTARRPQAGIAFGRINAAAALTAVGR
jgi:subtilisin family serine protease